MLGDAAHFDVIVVGSGFGGSVMAYRAAEAGKRVAVLERGKSYPPHSFPRTPHRMKSNVWDPSEGLQGLYNVWSFRHLGALVGSGLGGGSLIYANVLLRKDEKWFVREDLRNGGYEDWPVTRKELDPDYDDVERRIGVQRYPLDHSPYDQARKVRAFKAAAEKLGLEWQLPNLAVTFANAGRAPVPGEPIGEPAPNLHGRTRLTCTLCGECDIGCNTGSKNTLDYNYLSEAQRCGAVLLTRCEVKTFAPASGGYRVEYVVHESGNEGRKTDTRNLERHVLTCDKLVLAAGTLGSTFLMLKSRGSLPGVSPRALGSRFCGNGDLLTLAWKAREPVNGVSTPRVLDASFGPVIGSAIRVPDALDGGTGRGFYLQEAGYQTSSVGWFNSRTRRAA